MKSLSDHLGDAFANALCGEIEAIPVSDLRAHVGDCLDQISLGKSFCITRKGKIMAFMVPVANADIVHKIMPDGSCPTLGIAGAIPERTVGDGN